MFSWLTGGEEAKPKEPSAPAKEAAAPAAGAPPPPPPAAATASAETSAAAAAPAEEQTAPPAADAPSTAAATDTPPMPPSPPVIVRNVWAGQTPPETGAWDVAEQQLQVIPKIQKGRPEATTWTLAESAEPHDLELQGCCGESCVLYPVDSEEVTVCRPELIDPAWVAVGKKHVHWLQPSGPHKCFVLSQTLEDANGGSHGVRRVLTHEAHAAAEGYSADADEWRFELAKDEWKTCAARCGTPPPWWFANVKLLQRPKDANESLPPPLRGVRLSQSGYVWQVVQGWLSPSTASTWMLLQDNTVFFSPAPHSTEVEEFPLRGVKLVARHVEVSSSRTVQYPLDLRNANGKSVTLVFHNLAERDTWAALIEVSACQLQPSRQLPREKGDVYLSLLTMCAVPPCTPCVEPFEHAPETVSVYSGLAAASTGYVIVQADGGGGGWLAEGWRRRYTTVHDTFFTYRTHKDDMADLKVFPLRHASIAKTPQPENPWVFGVFSPFEAYVQVWCDSREAYARWLAVFDAAVRRANHARREAHAVSVDRLPGATTPDALLETIQLASGVVVVQHGIAVEDGNVLNLKYARESTWRRLDAEAGLVGCEEGEARWVDAAEAGAEPARKLEWIKDEAAGSDGGAAVPPVAPRHAVVRGCTAEAVGDGSVIADCLLPESVLSDSLLAKLKGDHKISSALLTQLPAPAEFTLRCSETHQWVAVLTGSVRVVVFPGSCYALITTAYPKILASKYNDAIGDEWGASSSPLSFLGGRQLVLNAGEAIFIPLDFFFSMKSLGNASVLRCFSKPLKKQ
eukprot:Rhum_TRINITY_DN14535_c8_g1::Rhum_TRINITY_DN14535_c8_g1_i1::g.98325::m.98325